MVFDRFGGPDVLEAREIADPAIAPDEALVRVRACGSVSGWHSSPGIAASFKPSSSCG